LFTDPAHTTVRECIICWTPLVEVRNSDARAHTTVHAQIGNHDLVGYKKLVFLQPSKVTYHHSSSHTSLLLLNIKNGSRSQPKNRSCTQSSECRHHQILHRIPKKQKKKEPSVRENSYQRSWRKKNCGKKKMLILPQRLRLR
jgi:hypothetical protein